MMHRNIKRTQVSHYTVSTVELLNHTYSQWKYETIIIDNDRMTVEVDFRKLSSSEEDSLKDHAYGIEFINKVVDSVEKRK